MLYLLVNVAEKHSHRIDIPVFIDCLVLLDNLLQWGKHKYIQGPKDVIQFEKVLSNLHELRQWVGKVVLVKVKSYFGCLLNEQAVELAELGCASEKPTLCQHCASGAGFCFGRANTMPWPEKIWLILAENQPSCSVLVC